MRRIYYSSNYFSAYKYLFLQIFEEFIIQLLFSY